MSVYPGVSSDIQLNMMEEKRSSQPSSFYTRDPIYHYDDDELPYEATYGDEPMSAEERALVRKIDFFVLPIICTINLLQVYKNTAARVYAANNKLFSTLQ